MNQLERQFLTIKHPAVLTELDDFLKNHNNPTGTLKPVDKKQYIACLATAGEGVHIDKIVEAVHSDKSGSGTWTDNKKRTATWLTQNSSDIVKKGIAGVVEKVEVIKGKATPATYKLTEEALAVFMASQSEDDEEQTGSEVLESVESDAPVATTKPVAPAKAKTTKKETANA